MLFMSTIYDPFLERFAEIIHRHGGPSQLYQSGDDALLRRFYQAAAGQVFNEHPDKDQMMLQTLEIPKLDPRYRFPRNYEKPMREMLQNLGISAANQDECYQEIEDAALDLWRARKLSHRNFFHREAHICFEIVDRWWVGAPGEFPEKPMDHRYRFRMPIDESDPTQPAVSGTKLANLLLDLAHIAHERLGQDQDSWAKDTHLHRLCRKIDNMTLFCRDEMDVEKPALLVANTRLGTFERSMLALGEWLKECRKAKEPTRRDGILDEDLQAISDVFGKMGGLSERIPDDGFLYQLRRPVEWAKRIARGEVQERDGDVIEAPGSLSSCPTIALDYSPLKFGTTG